MSAAPNVSSLVSTRRATAEDFGSGAGLVQAGKQVAAFGEELKQRKDRAEAVEIEKALIDADLQMSSDVLGMENEAPAGAAGHTGKVSLMMTEYEDRMRERYAASSPENKQRLELAMARMRRTQVGNSVRFQAKSEALKVRGDAENGLSTLRKSVQDGSASVDGAMEKATALIDATGLQGEVRRGLIEDFTSNIAADDIRRQLRAADSPAEVVALKAEAEELRDKFSPSTYEAVLQSIDKAEDTLRRRDQLRVREDIASTVVLAQNGESVEVFTEAEINAAYPDDPKKARDVMNAQARALREGAEISQVYSMSNTDVVAHMDKLDARAENTDLSLDERRAAYEEKARFERHIAERNRRIKADPVVYLEKEDPALADIRKEWTDAYGRLAKSGTLRDEAGARTAIDAARDKYVDYVKAASARYGISDVSLLTATEVKQVEAQLTNVELTPEGVQDLSDTFVRLQMTWGEHWPTVYRQLVAAEAIEPTHIALARLAGDPRKQKVVRDMAQSLTIDEGDYRKTLGSAVKDTSDLVAKEMAEFNSTVLGTDTPRRVLELQDSIVRIALYKQMKERMSMSDAVEYATKQVILDDYDIIGSYRIPKGMNTSAIEHGAQIFKNNVSLRYAGQLKPARDIYSADGKMDEQAQWASIRQRGTWVTNSDESGLILINSETGDPVRLKDNRFITATWSELQSSGETYISDEEAKARNIEPTDLLSQVQRYHQTRNAPQGQ